MSPPFVLRNLAQNLSKFLLTCASEWEQGYSWLGTSLAESLWSWHGSTGLREEGGNFPFPRDSVSTVQWSASGKCVREAWRTGVIEVT